MTEKAKKLIRRLTVYRPVWVSLAGIMAAGISSCYIERTIVDAWIVAGISAAIAVVPVFRLVKRGDDGSVWYIFRFVSSWFLCGAMISCIVLALNCHMADPVTMHSEQVTVESKRSETRYRSRRVRRNHVARGEPYKVYRVAVRFENGTVKEFSVPLSRYNSARPGGQFVIDVSRGMFGLPVLHQHECSGGRK